MSTDTHDLEALWRAEPENYEAFQALERFYVEHGDWRGLTDLFDAGSEQFGDRPEYGARLVGQLREMQAEIEDSRELGKFLVALGDACIRHLGNRDEAMKAYQLSFKTDPSDATCLNRARSIYRRSGEFDLVILLYKLQIKATADPADKARLLNRMAQVYGDDKRDLENALETLVKALELNPEDETASQLFDLYGDGETIYGVIQDLVTEARQLQDEAGEEAAVMYVQAAFLERDREAGALEQALTYATHAARLDPDNPEALALRLELRATLGFSTEEVDRVADSPFVDPSDAPQDELTDAPQTTASESAQDSAPEEPEHLQDEAQVVQHAEDTGLPDTIAGLIARLDESPDDAHALLALGDACRSEGSFDLLVEHFEHSVKRLRKKEGELEAMVLLANTLWHDVEDMERAEYYFKRIKLLDSDNQDMLAFYEAFFASNGQWKKLFNHINNQVLSTEDVDHKRQLTRKLATLALEEMDDPGRAIDAWKAYTRQVDEFDPEAHDALQTLFEDQERWSQLVDLYKEDLARLDEAKETVPERLNILEELADLYEHKLELQPMVVHTLESIIELDPQHRNAFGRLRALLETHGRHSDLARLLSDRADSLIEEENLAEAVPVLEEVANLWKDELRNVTQALPYLERVIELEPERQSTIDELKAIYEQRRDFKSLFDLLMQEASRLDKDRRLEKLRSILAMASDRVRDPELIAPVLEGILELAPDDTEALEQLENLRRRTDSPEKLVKTLVQKAKHVEEPEALKALDEAAALYRDELGDNDRAISIWSEVLERAPDDENAFIALSSTYREAGDFDALEHIYRKRESLDRLFEVLDSAASVENDALVRRDLFQRMARIAEEDLEDRERSIIALESLLDVSDEPAAIARQLISSYAQTNDLEKQVETYGFILEVEGPSPETLRALRDLERARENLEASLHWALQSVRLTPDKVEELDDSRAIAEEAGELRQWIDALEDIAADVDEASTQTALWLAAGEAAWSNDEPHRAIGFFERVRERHPEDLEILSKLDALYDETEQADRRVATLRAQIDVLVDRGATKADLVDELSKIADVQRSALGESTAARDTYAEILDIDPEHLPSLRGMRKLHLEEEQWDEVIECLLREESLVSTRDQELRHEVWTQLGEMYRLRREDLTEALRYYGMVLAADAQHDEALDAVEALLKEPGSARDAALLLEPIFRDAERPEPLARALEARRNATDDRFEEAEILDELIPLYQSLGELETAFDRACRQFELDAERSEIWLRLEQLGAKLNRWSELEKIFSKFAPTDTAAHATRFDLLRHLAAIREYQLEMHEEALQAWEQLYEYDPLDLAHVEALERLYRKLERHQQLVDTLVAKADLSQDPDERGTLLREAAQISDTILEDSDTTVEILRRLLEHAEGDREAVENLRHILRSQQRWAELHEFLSDQADLSTDLQRRRDLLLERARVSLNQLDDPGAAVQTVRRVFSEDPSDPEALAAVETLDQALEERGDALQMRLELANLVEPTYRHDGDQENLLRVLTIRLEGTDASYERLELLDELANLYQLDPQNLEAAYEMSRSALELDPADRDRKAQFEELARRSNRLADAASALSTIARDADPSVALDLQRHVAALLDEELGKPEEAIDAYFRALDIDESDAESLEALEGLLETAERYEELTDNLRHQVRLGDPARRLNLLKKIGAIEEDILERTQNAAEAYVQVLDMDPEDTAALRSLERLYRRQEDWLNLAETLERRISATLDAPEQLDALSTLAQVRETRLEDPPGAIETYRRQLEIDPTHLEAFDALERLHESQQNSADLADVLGQKLSLLNAEARDPVALKLAGVLAGELYATEEALDVYREVLRRQPGHPSALEALESLVEDEAYVEQVAAELIPHYRAEQAWVKLITLLDRLQLASHEPLKRAETFAQIGQIRSEHLDDTAGALEAYSSAWRLDVSNQDYENAVITLATNLGSWEKLAEVLRDAILEVHDPDRTFAYTMQLASIYRDHLDDAEQAEVFFAEAINLNDEAIDAYRALEEIMISEERWRDLVELLKRRFEMELESAPEAAIERLHQVAKLHEEQLDDDFTAVQTYERVLQLTTGDDIAVAELNRLYRAQQRWNDLSQLLNEEIARNVDPETAVDLRLELAAIEAGPLSNFDRAIEIYRDILDASPGHEAAVDSLELVLDDAPERVIVDAAEMLDPVYRARQDWTSLIRLLEAKAQALSAPDRTLETLRTIANVVEEHLDDPEKAERVYIRLFELDPGDRRTRKSLEALAARRRSWAALSESYKTVLADNFELSDEDRADVVVELAQIFEERLENLDEARRTYEEVLLLRPDHSRALDALERVYSRLEDWEALAELYRRRADEATDIETARGWREQMASVYEEVLDDSASAIDVYTEMLASDPEDDGARRSLERLLSHSGRWFDLSDLYRQQADLAKAPDRRLEFRFKLAQVLESELDQIDEALDHYKGILATNPKHHESRRALEGLARDLTLREDSRPGHRLQIIDLLLESYDYRTNRERVTGLLEQKIELVEDIPSKVNVYLELSEVLQQSIRYEERSQALSHLARAYQLDPIGSKDLEEPISKLANELDAWERLIPVYLEGLEATNAVESQIALLEALAEVFSTQLKDRDSAISVYQQILDIDPGHANAVSRLETLYGELELWPSLVEILQTRVDHEYDHDIQRSILERIARIQIDVLGQISHSISTYEKLRELEPARVDYIDALEALYEEAGHYEDLATLLRDRLGLTENLETRKVSLRKLALIFDEFLESPDRAIDTYRSVVEIDSESTEAIDALIRLYESTNQWPGLLDMLEHKLSLASDDDTANALELKIGRVLATELHSPFDALARYKAVLERDPSSMSARDALSSMLKHDDTRPEAVKILSALYRRTEEWRALSDLFELQLKHVEAPADRTTIFSRLASLQENELQVPQLAFMTFGRALRETPESAEIRQNLERLVESLDNYDELIAVYEDALELTDNNPAAQLTLHKRLGSLYHQFEEYDHATVHFEKALSFDEFDGAVLDHLDKLYQVANRWNDLEDVLEKEMVIADPSRLNDVRYRLGYLHEKIFENADAALEHYRDIVAEDATHSGALEGLERLIEDLDVRREVTQLLEPIYKQYSEWQRLARLYNLKLDVADDAYERADLLKRIAAIELERFERPAVAYAYYGRSLREDPMDTNVQEHLERIADKSELHEELVALYEEIIEDLTDPIRICELALVAGDLSVRELRSFDTASQLYERVLEIEPENERALGSLELIAREIDDSAALARILQRKAEVIFEPRERVEILTELGRVRDERDEFDPAIEAYRQALTTDESNVDVMMALVELLEITERYDELVEVLERLVGCVDDPDERFQLLVRIGQYNRVLLDDTQQAIDAYQRASTQRPDDTNVLEALDELYSEVEEWAPLRKILRKRLELATGEEARLQLLVRNATLAYENFGEVASAIEDYQRAMEIDPTHPIVIDALDGLYTSEQRWDDLFALYETRAAESSDPEQICSLRVRMADIAAHHLNDQTAAIDLLNTVLDAMPDHIAALGVLADLHETNEDWDALLDVLGQQLDAAASEQEKVVSLVRRARIHRDALQDPTAAAEDLVAIIEIRPLHEDALAELKELYESLGAHQQLYDMLDYEASHVDDNQKIKLYLEMAEIADKQLDSPARIAALEKAYELQPSELSIVEPLIDALISGGEIDRAEPILNSTVEALKSERRMKEVIRFVHLQGKLAEQRGDIDVALSAYVDAHKVDASYIPNLLSLGKLHFRQENWEEALKMFQTLLLHQMNMKHDADKVDVYYHLGMVRWHQGDVRRAKDMFNRALNIVPDHGPSKDAISQL